METCTICSKTFKDKRGLNGHNQFVHKSPANAAIAAKEKEDKPMVETAYCPGCDEKKDIIRDLKAAAKEAEAAHAQALQGKTREVEGSTAEITRLKAEAEAAKQQTATPAYSPPSQELIDHWLSCPNCRPEFDKFNKQWQQKYFDSLSPADTAVLMKKHNIEAAPNKIILTGFGGRELRR